MKETKSEVYINLSEEQLHKLDVIHSCFEEEVSRSRMIGGFIDDRFAYALEILNREGELSIAGLEHGLTLLPDWLQDRTREGIAAELEKQLKE